MRVLCVHFGAGMSGELLPELLWWIKGVSVRCVRRRNLRHFTTFLTLHEGKRVRGIEPPCAAWEAAVLPLNYTRSRIFDFRLASCDLQAPQSLPGNHVVGRDATGRVFVDFIACVGWSCEGS